MLDKVRDPNPFNIHTNDQDCLVVILEWQLAAKKNSQFDDSIHLAFSK